MQSGLLLPLQWLKIPSYCCRVDRRNGRGLFGGTTELSSSNYQEVENINIVGRKLHNGRWV